MHSLELFQNLKNHQFKGSMHSYLLHGVLLPIMKVGKQNQRNRFSFLKCYANRLTVLEMKTLFMHC